MAGIKPKQKAKQFVDDNPIEKGGVAASVLSSLKTDLAQEGISTLWDQMLGRDEYKVERNGASGDLVEGQEMVLKQKQEEQEEKEDKEYKDIEPGFDYKREVLYAEKRLATEDARAITAKIDEIIAELKRLTASSKTLQIEFKEVVVEQRIAKPGKYHVNFFEWVLSVVKAARIRVEDSGSWLALFKSKKKSRQYWAMFKKHGTTFGLSNERVVATQTG